MRAPDVVIVLRYVARGPFVGEMRELGGRFQKGPFQGGADLNGVDSFQGNGFSGSSVVEIATSMS